MQDRNSRLDVTNHNGVMVVELTDRKILDEINITQIGDQLTGLIAQADNPKMTIDFTNVDHMSSSALGMLITLHKRTREKGGQLVLCCIQPAIYEVFVITRLNEIFEIRETRDEAMEALK